MRGPRIGSDFVFAPARISPGLIVHLEQDKISEASFVEPPRGAQTCNATADDHDRVLCDLSWRRGKLARSRN